MELQPLLRGDLGLGVAMGRSGAKSTTGIAGVNYHSYGLEGFHFLAGKSTIDCTCP